ncbi:MAG: hypothetical protein WAT93_13975 [Pontixanthobacter sp.]
MTSFTKISAAASLAAALSMAAVPVAAAGLPIGAPTASVAGAAHWDSDSMNAERHRRYRGDRVDAGDVLAGVLIIGGIAAIASAASNSNKRDRRYREEAPQYREAPSNSRSGGGQGIDRAVEMCMSEIERNVRVESVDNVDRNGAGWNVSGTLYNGDGFSCQIDNNGRIGNVSYGQGSGGYQSGQVEDRQWNSDRYAAAWDRVDNGSDQADFAGSDAARSAAPYPGGPVDGDLNYDDDGLGG